jgi:Acetyltransferase (GNAT) domain
VNLQFRSAPAPPVPLVERIAACDPTNPFYTPEYVSACESPGEQACFVGLCSGEEVVSGCIGFLSGSFLHRSFTIRSLPSLPSPQTFWRGLLELCRALKVWHLQIDTYASSAGDIPRLPGELTRRTRLEHVLDLERKDVLDGLSSQHRRNISRAVKAGLCIHRTREGSAGAQHLELMNASLERRAKRGEEVKFSQQHAWLLALLTSRSGELFQAVYAAKILSSILILRSSQGAYYQSAGTVPEGMQLGASPFWCHALPRILKEEGARVFNLGGASADNPGLRRFKAGFGTREVALQAASFCPKSMVERKVYAALRSGWAWIRT